MRRWHDEEVEVEDEVDVAVHSRSRTRVIQLRRASCVDGVTFGAWSKSGASSIGVRTACSNTDAGPAVPAVAALLRCTDGIPSAHVRDRRNPSRPTLAGPKPTKVSRYIGLSAYGMIDYRYGAYSAYEAYRPRPLP